MPNTVQPSSYGPIYNITEQKSDMVLAAAANAGHKVTRVYGYNSVPDHSNKQCIDFMHYNDFKMRDWLVAYLINNAAALGVEGIISNRRVMGFPSNGSAYRGPQGQWRSYSGPSPHTDHVHVQFNTNAIKGVKAASVSKPKPAKKAWTGTLWLIKDTAWYDGSGKKRKVVKKGTKLRGTVDSTKFNDGRYFRVGLIPHRRWFPLDSGDFSHTKGGKPIG